MDYNGLGLLLTVLIGAAVHFGTRGYYVRQINDLRRSNRLLREAVSKVKK